MALDKVLKVYDDNGNEIDYDILAKDVKFLPDGKDLPTKLAELEDEIGQGSYTPPQGGIPKTDLSQDVQTSLDKADTALQSYTETDPTVPAWAKQSTKPTYTAQEVGALPADTPIPSKTSDLDNDSGFITLNDVPEGTVVEPGTATPSMDGNAAVGTSAKYAREDHVHPHDTSKQDALVAGNGIVIGNDGKTVSVAESIRTGAGKGATALQPSDVSVETPATPDGTVDINVGSNTYTINLNHTHEGMAKLEKHTPATMPDVSEMESDTIYAEIEDGEVNVLYVGGVPFYGGGGGGTSTPVLRQPADDSTIDMGNIASGESSVSKTITIKGKSLTQALTVAVTGTGYSVDKQSIPAADANVGTTLTITCTNTNGISAGTLSIASSEVSCDCDLVVYEGLRGVKLTGTQWLQTDYHPNPNTEFELTCHFEPNSHTNQLGANRIILRCLYDTAGDERFAFYSGTTGEYDYSAYRIFMMNKKGDGPYTLKFDGEQIYSGMTIDNAVLRYAKDSSKGTYSFTAGGSTKSIQTSLQTETMSEPMRIGYDQITNGFYNAFDLTIYALTITENGQPVHRWVPKLKDGTIPGLYDLENNKFISSETAKTSGLASDELVAIPLPNNN